MGGSGHQRGFEQRVIVGADQGAINQVQDLMPMSHTIPMLRVCPCGRTQTEPQDHMPSTLSQEDNPPDPTGDGAAFSSSSWTSP